MPCADSRSRVREPDQLLFGDCGSFIDTALYPSHCIGRLTLSLSAPKEDDKIHFYGYLGRWLWISAYRHFCIEPLQIEVAG